jgi:hypothetical protein
VLDGAILAGCIHALKNDEQRVLLCGAEDFLKLREALDIRLEPCFRMALGVKRSSRAGIEIREADVAARPHYELIMVENRHVQVRFRAVEAVR